MKIASGTRTRSIARSTTLWSPIPALPFREPCGGTMCARCLGPPRFGRDEKSHE